MRFSMLGQMENRSQLGRNARVADRTEDGTVPSVQSENHLTYKPIMEDIQSEEV
jgi:hypothetical protein